MIDLINPLIVRTLTTVEANRLKREYPDCPPGPERCITCRGRKKFTWWDDPGSKDRMAVEYECNCVEQWVLHRFFLNAGIGTSYQRLTKSDMDWCEPGAMTLFTDYMDHREDFVANGYGLFLHGSAGAGKTSLATLLLKRLMGEGHDGYFTTFNAMIEMFTAGWKDPEDKEWFHRRVRNAGVLVIDDPGKETKGRIELPAAIMDEIIRHRVADLRPTFITSNHTLSKFQEAYGEYVISLLTERASTYEFDGRDARPQARGRFQDEVRQGLTRPLVVI